MATIDIHAPGVEVKKSACYFCHQNCGVLAYVKDGKVIGFFGEMAPDVVIGYEITHPIMFMELDLEPILGEGKGTLF